MNQQRARRVRDLARPERENARNRGIPRARARGLAVACVRLDNAFVERHAPHLRCSASTSQIFSIGNTAVAGCTTWDDLHSRVKSIKGIKGIFAVDWHEFRADGRFAESRPVKTMSAMSRAAKSRAARADRGRRFVAARVNAVRRQQPIGSRAIEAGRRTQRANKGTHGCRGTHITGERATISAPPPPPPPRAGVHRRGQCISLG